MNKGISVKTIVAVGIGSAVFVVLGRFAAIPVPGIPNTNLELTHPFLALMAMIFGPLAGFLIGFIGHTLKDVTTYGSAWWSWIICSGIMGIIYGLIGKRINLQQGFGTKAMVWFNIFQAVGNGIVWGLIAPTLDILMYSEPANKVYVQGITSVIANIVITAVAGTILLKAYAATQTQQGSLKKD